ncbi:MAG: PilZ domain-containing protein [Candidatus Aminicenantales bacterium]
MEKKQKKAKKDPKKKAEPALSYLESKINRRGEWRFELPLDAIVEGQLPHGKKFTEEIRVENISSGGAYFCLDSSVIVGSKLSLLIELPEELTKGTKQKLSLEGTIIRLEEPDSEKKKQGVAVRFSKKFRIISEEEKNLK